MHDLNYFRDHLDVFAEMAEKRGATLDLDAFSALDKERRELITATEQLKAQRNKASDEIARLKKEKQDAEVLIAEMKQVSEHIKQGGRTYCARWMPTQREFLLTTPNLPHSSVPVGHSAEENVEVRRWGAPPKFDFAAKPHWEVGEARGNTRSARQPRKLPVRGSRCTKAGGRGWSGRWRIFFWMCTPGSMATRKFFRLFW